MDLPLLPPLLGAATDARVGTTEPANPSLRRKSVVTTDVSLVRRQSVLSSTARRQSLAVLVEAATAAAQPAPVVARTGLRGVSVLAQTGRRQSIVVAPRVGANVRRESIVGRVVGAPAAADAHGSTSVEPAKSLLGQGLTALVSDKPISLILDDDSPPSELPPPPTIKPVRHSGLQPLDEAIKTGFKHLDTLLEADRSKCVTLGLTPAHKFRLRLMFQILDYNGSGTLNVDNFASALRSLGLEVDLPALQARVVQHSGSNGIMEFDEFVKMMEAESDPTQESGWTIPAQQW